MKNIDRDMHLAMSGSEEDLQSLVYHPSSRVISGILLNSNLSESVVLLIASRKNLESDILEAIYQDRRWRESYRIIQALCRNPKTPQKIVLTLLKSLRIFDVADLTRNRQIPVSIRMRAEVHISEKILALPLGIKKALARRASANVLMRLIEDGMREVVASCLESPLMTEGMICKVINMKKTASHVIRQITEHPKWSCRYDVQWSLIRNNHAPLSRVVNFLTKIKTRDLQELYAASEVPSGTKPFLYRELMDREAL